MSLSSRYTCQQHGVVRAIPWQPGWGRYKPCTCFWMAWSCCAAIPVQPRFTLASNKRSLELESRIRHFLFTQYACMQNTVTAVFLQELTLCAFQSGHCYAGDRSPAQGRLGGLGLWPGHAPGGGSQGGPPAARRICIAECSACSMCYIKEIKWRLSGDFQAPA